MVVEHMMIEEHLMVDVERYFLGEKQELLHLSHFFLTFFELVAHVHYVHVPEIRMIAGSSSTEHLCLDHSASTLEDPMLVAGWET